MDKAHELFQFKAVKKWVTHKSVTKITVLKVIQIVVPAENGESSI